MLLLFFFFDVADSYLVLKRKNSQRILQSIVSLQGVNGQWVMSLRGLASVQ